MNKGCNESFLVSVRSGAKAGSWREIRARSGCREDKGVYLKPDDYTASQVNTKAGSLRSIASVLTLRLMRADEGRGGVITRGGGG